MQAFRSLRFAASSRLVFTGLVATLVACRDATTEDVAGNQPTRAAPIAGVSAPSIRARAAIHERNREDWVGVAHNKLLDDFRRELRKPGVATKNICEFVKAFAAREERLPRGRHVAEAVRWSAIRSAADSSSWCAKRKSSVLSPSRFTSPVEPLPGIAPQSSRAVELMGSIETAINQSETSFILAEQLNGILTQATTLDVADQLLVNTAVGVAQNSYEYWETQHQLLVDEFIDEYAPCMEENRSAGVPAETVRDNCLNGGGSTGAVVDRLPRIPEKGSQWVGVRRALPCGPTLREGFKKVVSADVKGAFAGFLGGAMTVGLEGAVLGALVGGGTASIIAAAENAWDTLKCMWGF